MKQLLPSVFDFLFFMINQLMVCIHLSKKKKNLLDYSNVSITAWLFNISSILLIAFQAIITLTVKRDFDLIAHP